MVGFRMEQYSPSIRHDIVLIFYRTIYDFAITVTSLSSIRASFSYPAKQRVFSVGMNYAELSSISRICKRNLNMLDLFSGCQRNFTEQGGGQQRRGSDPCFPDISHNVEKRLRIRTLFHVRAFKLIMDGRIPLSLFSFRPRGDSDERNGYKRAKGAGERTRRSGGSRIYTTRVDGWRVVGVQVDGEGRLHKYGNFVNQVSW